MLVEGAPARCLRRLASPPATPDAFVDAVLVAEGFDPVLVDKSKRRRLREVVIRFLDFD